MTLRQSSGEFPRSADWPPRSGHHGGPRPGAKRGRQTLTFCELENYLLFGKIEWRWEMYSGHI